MNNPVDYRPSSGHFWRAAVAGICLLLFASCAGRDISTTEAAGNAKGGPATPASLAAPSQLPLRHSSGLDLIREGTEFEHQLPNSRVLNYQLNSVRFEPNAGNGDSLTATAYAIYRFSVDNYSGPGEVRSTWLNQPLAGTAWMGLPDFSHDRWEWHQFGADGLVSFDLASGNYQDPNSIVPVVVLLTGTQNCALQSICLGPGSYPGALLLDGFHYCNEGDTITLDASPSFDLDGTLADFKFDPEGDGSFFDKGTVPNITHKYNQSGDFTAATEVTDNDGLSSFGFEDIHVGWFRSFLPDNGAGRAADILALPDGECAAVGHIEALGLNQGFICRLSRDGSVIFFKTFAEQGLNILDSIARDGSGNLYASGEINSDDFSGELVLLKFDESGGLLWKETVEGKYLHSHVLIDPEVRLVLSATRDNGVNPSSIYAGQFTLDGAFNWQKNIDLTGENLSCYSSCCDGQSNIYLGGSDKGPVLGDHEIGLVVSIDESGAKRFALRYGLQSLEDPIHGCCYDGNAVYLCGATYSPGGPNPIVVSISTSGSENWMRFIDVGTGQGYVNSLAHPLPSGGLVCGGNYVNASGQFGLLLQYDADGNLRRNLGFGLASGNGAQYGYAVGSLGEIFIAGSGGHSNKVKNLGLTATEESAFFEDVAGATVSQSLASVGSAPGVLNDAPAMTWGSGGCTLQRYYPPDMNP